MSAAPALSTPRRADVGVTAMVLATLLWGATFVVIRDVLRALAPIELIFLRFAAASGIFAVALAVRRRRIEPEALALGAVSGLCATGGFVFQAIGLTTASAGSSAFLTCAGTVLAAFFAWPLLGERPTATLLQGIGLALVGSALLSTHLGLFGPGELWTLLGAALFALQIIAVARGVRHADPLTLAALQSFTMALVLLPFARHAPEHLRALPPAALARLGYLVLAGSVTAPLLQLVAQRTLPPGRVGLLFALEPVFALLFALSLGGERFGPRWWFGAALILAGVIRVEWRAASAAAPSSSSATSRDAS
jgi:drug/metabolite transporter (DMT)-like permease